MLEAVAMAGGQYLAVASLVLMLDAVAMLGDQYLPTAISVGCVVVVWLRRLIKI
jgi:hypothetical protein